MGKLKQNATIIQNLESIKNSLTENQSIAQQIATQNIQEIETNCIISILIND